MPHDTDNEPIFPRNDPERISVVCTVGRYEHASKIREGDSCATHRGNYATLGDIRVKFAAISVPFRPSRTLVRRNDTSSKTSLEDGDVQLRGTKDRSTSPVIPCCPYICLSSISLSGMDRHCSYRLGLSRGLMRMARPFIGIRLGNPDRLMPCSFLAPEACVRAHAHRQRGRD